MSGAKKSRPSPEDVIDLLSDDEEEDAVVLAENDHRTGRKIVALQDQEAPKVARRPFNQKQLHSSKNSTENNGIDKASTSSKSSLGSGDGPSEKRAFKNPYLTEPSNGAAGQKPRKRSNGVGSKPDAKKAKVLAPSLSKSVRSSVPRLQAGLVLEEDMEHPPTRSKASFNEGESDEASFDVETYIQQQHLRSSKGEETILFEDADFPPMPRSIRGAKKVDKKVTCRCKGSQPAKLDYKTASSKTATGAYQQTQALQPFYKCARNKCKFFSYAFQAERMHWYRYGVHSGHTVVGPKGFSASDLCQGRVGDCWFLSALAVVAERPDLILRLFGNGKFTELSPFGICQVNLFLDGYWKPVVVDNFLPCLIDKQSESQLQHALQASMSEHGGYSMLDAKQNSSSTENQKSSKYNPLAIADQCQGVLRDTQEFLLQDLSKRPNLFPGTTWAKSLFPADSINRPASSEDLAYSKAKGNQLWVPLLEKAYAKSHGSYKAISGGHIAEAFLDLTGAPTLVYEFDSPSFVPRQFWFDLMRYRKQRLPMGCATAQSQVGIIGMHAYSILDVIEVKNVSRAFFQETGVAHGNVSGFTEFDGTVRLLQIRNPHGKSEWKGDFSDHSGVWEKLLRHQGGRTLQSNAPRSPEGKKAAALERTMQNDGKFWIDYDSFLMGFTNVDVVLAFLGNNAKSFASNFPPKKSNHRCTRAFEVCLLDPQPGVPSRDKVEVYVMGIQKTRRGAGHGRSDRKVSYKVCDLGMLVGKVKRDSVDALSSKENPLSFGSVQGQMFGFQRNGHYRMVLDQKENKSFVVMPISFGHPTATDKELPFVLRFVSDSPLLIRELEDVPRMDYVLQKFCLSDKSSFARGQGKQTIVLESEIFRLVQVECLGGGGGVVFLYYCWNSRSTKSPPELIIEARCRGMTMRCEDGLLEHETIAKGKKFEAAWRKYKTIFPGERRSRLLAVLYQSGQDYEFGGKKNRSTVNAVL